MAKEESKTEKTEFKYGIEDVSKALGIEPASARVRLRNANIKKAGKSYGWNSKAEVEEVVKKLENKKPEKKEPAKKAASTKDAKKPEKKTKEAA